MERADEDESMPSQPKVYAWLDKYDGSVKKWAEGGQTDRQEDET
jgi:hypothetical protein